MNEAGTTIKYISRSYATLALKVSSFAQLFLGKIEGLTRFLTRGKAYMSYASIADEFGVSERQAMRVVKQLVDMDVLEQVYDPKKQTCAYYRSKLKDDKRGFISTPLYLKEKVFSFEYLIDSATGKKITVYNCEELGQGDTELLQFERTLTDIELTILSLMATHGSFEGTVKTIAGKIGKSKTSVQNALDGLLHCKAIERTGDETSKSRRDKSTYRVEETLLKEIKDALEAARRKPKKTENVKPRAPIAPTNTQKSPQQAAIDDINARSERERYYDLLREKADNKAEKVRATLNKNEKYKKARSEYRDLEIALVRAEKEPQERRRIIKRRNQLSAIMYNIMETMGYKLADTEPQYRCKKCNDTGYKKDGTACTCYPKGNV